MVKTMNKSDFIKQLSKQTNYSETDCVIINDILENNFFISKNSREKIISEIAIKFNTNREEASNIYDIAKEIINNQIKRKLHHPFGSR